MSCNMPARSPKLSEFGAQQLVALGMQIRQVRKGLGINATTAAEAAGMSRVTLHRIERGEPSVTMGAYLAAMSALGLELSMARPNHRTKPDRTPGRLWVKDFPELDRIMWHQPGVDEISRRDAFAVYERNWRYIDREALTSKELRLIAELSKEYGGQLLVP